MRSAVVLFLSLLSLIAIGLGLVCCVAALLFAAWQRLRWGRKVLRVRRRR